MERVSIPGGLGGILAILVIVLCLVFAVIGALDYKVAGLIGVTALTRLV